MKHIEQPGAWSPVRVNPNHGGVFKPLLAADPEDHETPKGVLASLSLCIPGLYMIIQSGWWLTYPSEKYEFVSWDDYSQYMEK